MKVLVTGHDGNIGPLVHVLRAAGHDVLGLDGLASTASVLCPDRDQPAPMGAHQRRVATSVDCVTVCRRVDVQRLGVPNVALVPNGYVAPPRPVGRITAARSTDVAAARGLHQKGSSHRGLSLTWPVSSLGVTS